MFEVEMEKYMNLTELKKCIFLFSIINKLRLKSLIFFKKSNKLAYDFL